jgi:dienelactone hydrolase
MVLNLIRRTALTIALAGALASLTAVAVPPAQAAARSASAAGTTSPAGATVVIQDVVIPVPGHPAVRAYLVRPGGHLRRHRHAGILFLHWLGQIHSDRTEFLAEATELASQGAVSLLPEGKFPWQVAPVGSFRDVESVEAQLSYFRHALTWLIGRWSVDPHRVAVVGHDYGAMYGALLANSDRRVHAAVLATPDATWGHWFVKYWLGYTGKRAAHYEGLFDKVQPVDHASRLGSHELFQWAGQDIYAGASIRHQFARHAPRAQVDFYAGSDHQLTDAAMVARDAFLTRQLGLTG